jgi:hypothetical protein
MGCKPGHSNVAMDNSPPKAEVGAAKADNATPKAESTPAAAEAPKVEEPKKDSRDEKGKDLSSFPLPAGVEDVNFS